MGCNEVKSKRELIRIVREPDGKITLDERGKISGRGVYICPDLTCFAKARKANRLSRSLEVEIPDEVYKNLEERLKEINTQTESPEV